ncbi:CRISPR-associated helicase Cas3' [Lactobacillus sp. PSON]|uniref:CRISPR-associated helicase Cas3' n=1 Tax=Lactobacillus sp. PSON TaxID=3455454 RepID=UPI0040428A9E
MKRLSIAAQTLWGKKSINEDGNELWLPLIAHMIDTKNVINWLYNHYLNEGQRRIIQESIDNEELAQNLVKFLGFIHDIGKATPVFQTKQSYNHSQDLDDKLIEQLIESGFENLEDVMDEFSDRDTPHAKAGEVILEENGLNESLGAIIGGHHGIPQAEFFDFDDEYQEYLSNYVQYDGENNEIQEKWKSTQKELIEYGLDICELSSLDDLPEVSQSQAVILNGLVIMADWLASSFPLISLDQKFLDLDMNERLKDGILNWISNTGKWEPESITDSDELYQKRFGFTPRNIQYTMSEAIQNSTDPGMIIIEAPMGIGKTEIALTAAEELATKTGRNELFFGLPTQATTNAMFNRVQDWLNNIASEEQENLPIKLMHGKAQFNKEYQKIPDAQNVDDEGSVVINSWFSGKKSILTDFTIGTIDHLLLMGLKQRHLSLRHLGLSGKIVIIDEIHAYDTYMNSYLKKVIKWLGSYHVPIIALSATLPIERRNELLEAYAEGKYLIPNIDADDSWNDNCAYPLMSILDGDKLTQISDFESTNSPTDVTVKRLVAADEATVEKIYQSIKDGGVAGVIVNTVKRSQSLAKIATDLLPNDVNILVLHSAYLATEREKLEQKLQNLIGKDGKRPQKLIVIGTQVLEQSLDIDFDILFTDIAPMDLLLQRTGRLHRHNISRPKKLKKPQLYVMGIDDFGSYGDANEAIYDKYLLMKTDYFLKDKLILPTDISKLVQLVYSEENNADIKDIEDDYYDFKAKNKKKLQASRAFQICEPNSDDTIHGWLSSSQVDVDKDESKAQAAVRDIEETIEVILLKHTKNKDYLIDGTNIEELPSLEKDKIIATQIIRLPRAITYNIDKSIKKLENLTQKYYYSLYKDSVWLKGSLILPLDENLEATLNGYRIKYSSKYGLSYSKE